MSYALFVQRFEHGVPAPMQVAAFRTVFEPYVSRADPEYSCWRVDTPDGGEAAIYADLVSDTFDSMMINRFSNGTVLDLIVRFIGLADAVVLPQDRPALLADEPQREHLPNELRAAAMVIRQGKDIERVLGTN